MPNSSVGFVRHMQQHFVMETDRLSGTTVGDPAIADFAVARAEEELIWALKGGNHRMAFEQPGSRLKHGTGIGSEPVERHDKRRLGIRSLRREQMVMAVEASGKRPVMYVAHCFRL